MLLLVNKPNYEMLVSAVGHRTCGEVHTTVIATPAEMLVEKCYRVSFSKFCLSAAKLKTGVNQIDSLWIEEHFENLRFQFSRVVYTVALAIEFMKVGFPNVSAHFSSRRGWGLSSSIFLATCGATSLLYKLESVVSRITSRLLRNNIQSCALPQHVPRSKRRFYFLQRILGPVVRRPISANPGLNFNLGFYFSLFKSCLRIIFSIYFQSIQSKNWRQKDFSWIFFFKLSDLKSNFILILGYLNPALNNPALVFVDCFTTCAATCNATKS